MSFLVVLVAVNTYQTLAVAGNTARRDTALGQFISSVIGFCFVYMLFDLLVGQVQAGDIVVRVNKIMVGQNNYRHLVLVSEVKCLLCQIEGVIDLARSQKNSGKLTVACVERQLKVALLCSGWQAGGRARPLCKMNHYGRLKHTRQADSLRHQGKAAT